MELISINNIPTSGFWLLKHLFINQKDSIFHQIVAKEENMMIFSRPVKITMAYLVILTLCLGLPGSLDGLTFYPFQEIIFDFSGKDSDLVKSFDYDGNDAGNQSSPYGMIVDPEGKMWLGFQKGFTNEIDKSPGERIRLTGLRCFINDSTEASFSPIELIEFPDGSKDTLYEGNPYNGFCRGISQDEDGHILFTAGATLYKIDYRDGSGISRFNPMMIGKPLRTHISAVRDCTYIYFAPYPQYEQLNVLDTNLQFVFAGLTMTASIENAIQVRTKADGTTQLFAATHLNGRGILVYETPDPASVEFSLVDTIGNFTEETDSNTITYYAWANSLDWLDKKEGILIYGNDYRAMVDVSSGTAPEHPLAARWVIIDVDTDEVIAWIGAPWFEIDGGIAYPREISESVPFTYLEDNAMGMSPNGVIVRNGNLEGSIVTDKGLNCVQRVSYITGISDSPIVPYSLELFQNYPNPFNPMTNIRFELPRTDRARLDIYDLRGRRVMRVLDARMDAGTHNIYLNSDGLASGTYIYTLHTSALSVSRKMTIIK